VRREAYVKETVEAESTRPPGVSRAAACYAGHPAEQAMG
jgi:hypothetical protein